MYNSTDGKKAGILKDTDTTYNNGSTLYGGACAYPVTIDVVRSWPYLNAPEYKEPVVVDTSINPDYIKLAQIAYDTILQTMMEGEKVHGADEWKKLSIYEHGIHAAQHIMDHSMGYTAEDHIAHAMTRCAMIKMLEDEQYGIKSKA